jgi:hypothetical protein
VRQRVRGDFISMFKERERERERERGIPETCLAHSIRYLRFSFINKGIQR